MNPLYYFKQESLYKNELNRIAEEYRIPYFFIRMDCFSCKVIYGINPSHYIAFQFYKLRGRERTRYVTARKSERIERAFNIAPRSEKDQIGKKALFNKTFAQFVQRDWLFVPDATEEEVDTFLKRHDKIIVKPNTLTQGEGVHLLSKEELENGVHAFYIRAVSEDYLLETFIKQHPILNTVNPSSVNTLRVCSVRDTKGKVHIVGASLRAGGAGSVVDNLHAEGVQYPVDPESGIIIRGGFKHNGERDIYFHSSTGFKMIGLQIPNWESVIETVKKAGTLLPNLRYIGWDIAVTEEGCEIIEANIQQGFNGMQQDGVGKYNVIMQYI